MADELESGVADTGQPAETTTEDAPRSIAEELRSAYDAAQETGGETEGRVRGPDGRFAPRTAAEQQAAGVDDPAAAKARQGVQQPGAEQQPGATPTAAQAPQHWPEADKAAFAKAPPDVQARWIERETQFQRAYTDVTQKLKGAEQVMRHFEPHLPALQKAGVHPEQYVAGWIKIEERLNNKDARVFAEAVKAYGIDPAAVIAALGGQGGQQQAEAEYVDPKVAALERQIQELRTGLDPRIGAIETQLTTQQKQAHDAALNGIAQQITEFSSAKSADGQLAHPYYAEVEETMMILAHGELAAGKGLTVKDLDRLYDSAVHANPTVRAKVLADSQRADEAKRAAEAKAKAAAARTAGSSIAGTPSAGLSPSAQGQNLTIGQQLRAAAREVRG